MKNGRSCGAPARARSGRTNSYPSVPGISRPSITTSGGSWAAGDLGLAVVLAAAARLGLLFLDGLGARGGSADPDRGIITPPAAGGTTPRPPARGAGRMTERAEDGSGGQPEPPTPGGVRVLHWLGMLALIAAVLAGLGWVLQWAGRG